MVIIDDDELCYEHWIEDNPAGFVLNAPKAEGSGRLMMHKAWCYHIAPAPRWSYTNKRQLKVCSQSRDDLRAWSARRGREMLLCRHCCPYGDDRAAQQPLLAD